MLFTLVTVMVGDMGEKGWRVCSRFTLNATTKTTRQCTNKFNFSHTGALTNITSSNSVYRFHFFFFRIPV
jgi:hypothetical protein